MRRSVLLVLALVPLANGCLTGRAPRAGEHAVADSRRCGGRLAGMVPVQARGFSFCVPEQWQQLGPYTWLSENGSRVTWDYHGVVDTLAPPSPTVRSSAGAIVVTSPAADGVPRRSSEKIGGIYADLTSVWRGGYHLTSARWRQRGVVFFGEAVTPGDAAAQWEVYRTVRFTEPPDTAD